jgi:hypothetical protein
MKSVITAPTPNNLINFLWSIGQPYGHREPVLTGYHKRPAGVQHMYYNRQQYVSTDITRPLK